MKILADIGGTYARFLQVKNGKFLSSEKYEAAKFKSIEAALAHYCKQHGLKTGGRISIATAAYEDAKGNWRFVNKNKWVISAANLKKAGWTLDVIMNDFAAATWGLLAIKPSEIKTLHKGKPSDRPLCLTGPGTGLGLGYLFKTSRGVHVQRTHGGHMIAAVVTDEQCKVIENLGIKNAPVFENLVSGPGLLNIYKALCKIDGAKPLAKSPEDMLEHARDKHVKTAIRIFHEFLGLHARAAVITAHAYGGLYLTGGVLKQLAAHGLFDSKTFRKYFTLPGVASVTQDLKNTPVIHFTGSHLAMKGLLEFESHK